MYFLLLTKKGLPLTKDVIEVINEYKITPERYVEIDPKFLADGDNYYVLKFNTKTHFERARKQLMKPEQFLSDSIEKRIKFKEKEAFLTNHNQKHNDNTPKKNSSYKKNKMTDISFKKFKVFNHFLKKGYIQEQDVNGVVLKVMVKRKKEEKLKTYKTKVLFAKIQLFDKDWWIIESTRNGVKLFQCEDDIFGDDKIDITGIMYDEITYTKGSNDYSITCFTFKRMDDLEFSVKRLEQLFNLQSTNDIQVHGLIHILSSRKRKAVVLTMNSMFYYCILADKNRTIIKKSSTLINLNKQLAHVTKKERQKLLKFILKEG